MTALTMAELLAERCARTGETPEVARRRAHRLADFHVESLPEALYREGYCRPRDSREAASVVRLDATSSV